MIITDITYIGDPQILYHDGKYYCYVTNTDHYSDGFAVLESTDLVNWGDKITCLHESNTWGVSHFWAPEVVYHGGKFVMHYTAKSEKLNSLRIGVAVSDSPTGPFVDVHGEPMFDFGYAAIDGSVLRTDEGNYLYFSRDCSENLVNGVHTSEIYCVQLSHDLTKTVGEATLMTTPSEEYEKKSLSLKIPTLWNEGPTVIKHGDEFVMNYSANCYATNDYSICLAVSKSPLGPWVKPASNPVLSCNADLFGAGHNAFFEGAEGRLMTAFHIQTDPGHPSGNRRVVIGEVVFSECGGETLQKII